MQLIRKLSLFLSVCILIAGLSGCGNQPVTAGTATMTETTAPTEPKPTETTEEANALRIMIIGSSRSVNTFYHLYSVFKDQIPDQEITLGVMYYSGGSMSMHADFIRNNEAVVTYYRNHNTDGYWELIKESSTQYGLQDQKWDVILLQSGSGDTANDMNLEDRLFITGCVDTWLKDHPQKYELGENETHINFRVDDIEAARKKHDEMGCVCFVNEGMGLYFIEDPDGYWFEITPAR